MIGATTIDPALAKQALIRARGSVWVPAYLATIALFIAGHWLVGPGFTTLTNVWAIVIPASFVAIAGAGQGLVILSGGIDLSIPAGITVGGVATSWLTFGSGSKLVLALPLALLLGAGLGVVNGLGIAVLNISPVVMTIASNGITFGILLVLTGGTPPGSIPSALVNLMHHTVATIPLVVFVLAGFVLVISLIMSQTSFGKRVYAIGNSFEVARLSGVRIPSVSIGVYAISGVTAALTGELLTGYTSAS
jgi:ribose transport system permease protein